MDSRTEFNNELADWLEGLQTNFEEKGLQKKMFRIITEPGAMDGMSDDEKKMIKKIRK